MKFLSISGRLRPMASAGASVAAAIAVAVPLGVHPAPAAAAVAEPSFGGEISGFYRARGGAPLWFAPSAAGAPQQLLQLLATAQADNLNPKRYNVRGVSRAIADAMRGGPGAVQRAEAVLSAAFVAYARDLRHDPRVGVIYVDPELKPAPPSARALLADAAKATSLTDYVQRVGWMNPIYGQLRQAIASRLYRNEAERRLLILNLERARALPSGTGRYALINAPAARLYMYENGQVVDRCGSSPASPIPRRRRR